MRNETPVVVQKSRHDANLVDVGGRRHGLDRGDLGFLRGESIPGDFETQEVDGVAADDGLAGMEAQCARAAHTKYAADVLCVFCGGVRENEEVVLVSDAKLVETVLGEFGIHDALENL